MEKVLFKTKYDKDIVEGQQYYAVNNKGEVMELKAESSQAKDKSIVERFLTTTGANKLASKILAKLSKAPVEKSQADLEEEQRLAEVERLAKLNPLEQLDEVKSQEDFKTWLTRNRLTVIKEASSMRIGNLISFSWGIGSLPGCCGAREIHSHNGSIETNSARFITPARMEVLATYLAPVFVQLLRNNGHYGYVSYIRDAGIVASAYGRMSYIFAHSPEFVKSGTFNNPNGGKELDIYTVTQNL